MTYRMGDKHNKSIRQYKRERERRLQVRLLSEQGLSQAQIAQKLAVSIRTVKRDCKKIGPYIKGQKTTEKLQKEADRLAEHGFKIFDQNPTPAQRDILSRFVYSEAVKDKSLTIYINMDKLTQAGYPTVTTLPLNANNFEIADELNVRIRMKKNGKSRNLFRLRINLRKRRATSTAYQKSISNFFD